MSRTQPETPFDRSSPPAPGAVRPFHLPAVASDRLDNGLLLRSMKRTHVPLVSVDLVLNAGEVTVPAAHEGLAVLAGDALEGGTKRRSGSELAEAFERLGAGLRVMTGWDATTVTFTCVADRLDEMLGLVAEVVREPSFPEEEVVRVRARQLATIQQNAMDPGHLADDALDAQVFGPDHPYHRPLTGTTASVGELGLEEVRGFVSGRYGPDGGGLVFAGDLSEDQVRALAEKHFGDWKQPSEAFLELPDLPAAPVRTIRIVSRPGAVQSEIRVGDVTTGRGDPDEVALSVANSVLGGAFTSRLNLSLREKHGFTYGVHSRFSRRREGGRFSIGTAVQTEVTAAALREIMDVVGHFVKEGPTTAEVERTRDYLAGVFPLRMETTAQLASRLAELVVYGLPDDYHAEWREEVRRVNASAAGEAVRRHLAPERMAIVIVGDADRIVDEVGALDLGAVEVDAS